ncbi:MAG TPA: tRNA (adenosine(37)-N6)-threonylcarbamoyltransferase complex dimerization subunit type 1 TsaB [Flavobacteriia bacterium]|nr:tRNA (adenosine(37)-N6)-threonylcarbamoyltransferase complex dimerization subunit type 1 TsaB [Flavobacteriia bacterium]
MQKDIYILNIETSTKNCSVSVSKNGQLSSINELCEVNFSHAEKLPSFIENVLKEANIDYNDLSAIAVGKGPGSYTGLRIGVSSAKGLCFGLDIPLIAIESLEILANAIEIESGYIIPMLDARRLEVYAAVFNAKKEFVKPTINYLLESDSFKDFLTKDKVYFIGDGVVKTKDIIHHKNAKFVENYHPSTKEMANLSYIKYVQKDFEDVAYFEPFYLKDFYVTVSKKK